MTHLKRMIDIKKRLRAVQQEELDLLDEEIERLEDEQAQLDEAEEDERCKLMDWKLGITETVQ